jgi:hypothetical protein
MSIYRCPICEPDAVEPRKFCVTHYEAGWRFRGDELVPPAAAVPKQGIKLDTGKPALDLIDPHFLEEVGQVLTFGARKYEPDNWRRGMFIGKALAGVLRHVVAILRGEHRDPETGLQHAAHATCGLMFVFHYIRTGQTSTPDDRWTR